MKCFCLLLLFVNCMYHEAVDEFGLSMSILWLRWRLWCVLSSDQSLCIVITMVHLSLSLRGRPLNRYLYIKGDGYQRRRECLNTREILRCLTRIKLPRSESSSKQRQVQDFLSLKDVSRAMQTKDECLLQAADKHLGPAGAKRFLFFLRSPLPIQTNVATVI